MDLLPPDKPKARPGLGRDIYQGHASVIDENTFGYKWHPDRLPKETITMDDQCKNHWKQFYQRSKRKEHELKY